MKPLRELSVDGRAFIADVEEVRRMVVDHEDYGPRFDLKIVEDGNGDKRAALVELWAEDGTNEGKRGHELYLQLLAWPQLKCDEEDHSTGVKKSSVTSSHFRVPISMGRFKEKKDVLHEHYGVLSSCISNATTLSSRHFPGVALHIEKYHMDDLKAVALKLNKKHTASHYPCPWCVRHKCDLHLRSYIAADTARFKKPTFLRHMELPEAECKHDFTKASPTCGCVLPAARHLDEKFGKGCEDNTKKLPTHAQDHECKKAIGDLSDKKLFGIVGFPLYPDVPLHRRLYGVWHATQNCRVAMCAMIKKSAAVLDRVDEFREAVSQKPIDLPHWSVGDVQLTKKKGANKEGTSAMEDLLAQHTIDQLNVLVKDENTRATRASLDGEEMRRLMAHSDVALDALRVYHEGPDGQKTETAKSKALVDALDRMLQLWDVATEPLLALTWKEDRSEEIKVGMRAWRDHIHESFGSAVGMPNGEDLLDCMPVHYVTEHVHDHAGDLFRRHGIAIGCLTDQAGEQYNQLVKRHITPGQGSRTNGAMCTESRTSSKTGRLLFSNNKFWLEMQKLYRVFFKHNLRHIEYTPRVYRNCGACGGPHRKNALRSGRRVCPQHKDFRPC